MNTNQLRTILKRDKKIRYHFIDVFALDHFKEFVKRNSLHNGLYICNSDTSSRGGEHWFLVFVTDEKIYFFDSFGNHPEYFSIGNELYSSERDLIYFPIQLQSSTSSVCGHFCIFFSFFLCRKYNLQKIYRKFSHHYEKNEELVFNFVNKIFS